MFLTPVSYCKFPGDSCCAEAREGSYPFYHTCMSCQSSDFMKMNNYMYIQMVLHCWGKGRRTIVDYSSNNDWQWFASKVILSVSRALGTVTRTWTAFPIWSVICVYIYSLQILQMLQMMHMLHMLQMIRTWTALPIWSVLANNLIAFCNFQWKSSIWSLQILKMLEL